MPSEVGQALELFIEALRRQAENYRALGDAVRDFARLLDAQVLTETLAEDLTGDAAFPEILARQAQWAGEVERIETKIAEIRERLGAALGLERVTLSSIRKALEDRGLLEAHRPQLELLSQAVAEVIALARQVKEATESNERRLRASLGSIRGKLEDLQVGKDVAQAYGRVAKGIVIPPKFVDKKVK